jgi:hypothetical protein
MERREQSRVNEWKCVYDPDIIFCIFMAICMHGMDLLCLCANMNVDM